MKNNDSVLVILTILIFVMVVMNDLFMTWRLKKMERKLDAITKVLKSVKGDIKCTETNTVK